MDTEVFFSWMQTTVFPKLSAIGKKCDVVLDRATYRKRLTWNTQPMTTGSSKRDLRCVVMRWGGPDPNWPADWKRNRNITKTALLQHCKLITLEPKYEIRQVADKFSNGDFSIKISFLPRGHPELNPIELDWIYLKYQIRNHNFKFNFSLVKRHARQLLVLQSL